MNTKGRIAVTLEPEIYQWIVERAAKEGRSLANLAAFLLTGTVKEQVEKEATKDQGAEGATQPEELRGKLKAR